MCKNEQETAPYCRFMLRVAWTKFVEMPPSSEPEIKRQSRTGEERMYPVEVRQGCYVKVTLRNRRSSITTTTFHSDQAK